MKNKQLIIIGGGVSLKEGINKDLWNKLEGHLTFGLNYSYKYFISTAQFFVDEIFYIEERDKMKDLPLIIGKYHKKMNEHPNTVLVKAIHKYDPTLKTGCYKSSLVGLYALSIAIYLKPKEIFLLGYDYGATGKDKKGLALSHFYQDEINHRGIGKINYYTCKGRGERDFKPYIGHGVIYNVSLTSTIPTFKKLSYDEFFKKLENKTYSQDTLRKQIIEKIKLFREN